MYTFNEHYLDIIDSADKAYLLGFICTDGNLYKRENHSGQLGISLKDADEEVLNHFLSSFSSNHPITRVKDKRRDTTMSSIVFVNDYLYNHLNELGITNNKTFSLDYNKIINAIPKQFIPTFYLGIFDGDGNIDVPKNGTISKSHVRIAGPIKQLLQLQQSLPYGQMKIIEDKRTYSEPFGSLEATGTINKYIIIKSIYKIPVQCLSRKKNAADELIRRIENNVTNRAENIQAVEKWEKIQAGKIDG